MKRNGERAKVNRSKTIVLNTNIIEGVERNGWRKEVESVLKGRNQSVQSGEKNGSVKYEVTSIRKNGSSLTTEVSGRKELEIRRTGYNEGDSSVERKKRRQKERDTVCSEVKARRSVGSRKKETPKECTEWKEQVVRVGTGYRVRKDEKDPRKRRFDVGYADLKSYKRKEGREATVDGSNMGRTVVGKGKDARVKVMNAVCAMEKRRVVSEYTGSGILRKSMVGKLKLKPTKSGKE